MCLPGLCGHVDELRAEQFDVLFVKFTEKGGKLLLSLEPAPKTVVFLAF